MAGLERASKQYQHKNNSWSLLEEAALGSGAPAYVKGGLEILPLISQCEFGQIVFDTQR